ncbi:MAG: P-aminobenzoate N-oxygenase AurF [Bdellovibrionales bacterium]|nr:P-aminobenzoate N-oxygenase AurF [Bdellovibrionales bacterium]
METTVERKSQFKLDRPAQKAPSWKRRVEFALKKSKELDQTANIDLASEQFRYEDCANQYWNPEQYSFMWGTQLWQEATASEKRILNQIYWVAYYSQIISAEIATIYFNQASAASLFSVPDFRSVCDTLDLESSQERAHISAFTKVGRQTEKVLFGGPIFCYPLRTPFEKTMVHSDLGSIRQWIRKWQLKVYPVLSSDSPYIGAQYFTIRALRTLNGKIVQDRLSRMSRETETSAAPSKISEYHFLDESFHFNTSMLLSKDIMQSIPKPTRFEKLISNIAISGCQKDHYHYSTALNGIFWYDPALFNKVYQVLTSRVLNLSRADALQMMEKCFCEDSEGMQKARETHTIAIESYQNYLSDVEHLWASNYNLQLMKKNSIEKTLKRNKLQFKKFKQRVIHA